MYASPLFLIFYFSYLEATISDKGQGNRRLTQGHIQASLPIANSQGLFKLMSNESVIPSNHLILCHPLLLLPSIFLSIKGLF